MGNLQKNTSDKTAFSSSKILVLCESVKARIESGEFLAGTEFPSTSEIAKEYGVSYVTAHKALGNLVEKGLLERRNGVGTFVRASINVKFDKIGIPLRLEGNPFFISCYETISKVAERFSLRAVFGNGVDELSMLERFAADGIKAVIRFPGGPYYEKPIWDKLSELNMRTVILNDWWLDGGPFPCVKTDEQQAARLMLDYLYSQGHRKIALLQDVFEENRFDLMKEFNSFHLEHGIIPKQEQIIYYTEEKTQAIIESLKDNKITAVFSCFDFNTLRLLKNLTNAGIRIPEDISIASFDGTHQMEDMGITALRQNVPQLVEEAFKIILSESYNHIKTKKIPAEIIIGNSVCNITAAPQSRGEQDENANKKL